MVEPDSSGTCDWCGEDAECRFTLEFEWPPENPDVPFFAGLEICADCSKSHATDVLVDRAVTRGLRDVYHGLHDVEEESEPVVDLEDIHGDAPPGGSN